MGNFEDEDEYEEENKEPTYGAIWLIWQQKKQSKRIFLLSKQAVLVKNCLFRRVEGIS